MTPRFSFAALLLTASLAFAGGPGEGCGKWIGNKTCDEPAECTARKLFESDHAFESFIGPISNPVLSKDPRSLTEARLLFVGDWVPQEHPFGGGNFQVYGAQLRLAVTERLTLIADKDGYGTINPEVGGNRDGWLNMAFGAKYAFVRDVDNQLLVTGGFQYEPNMGESEVFQNNGHGVFTGFLSAGKGWCNGVHVIGNVGYQFPVDDDANSSFIYSQIHLDKQICGWIYPLIEANWFHYTQGGNHGIPSAIGEGDGLLNLGTTGVANNDLVTIAVGVKAIVNRHLDIGLAYERPVSNRKDLIEHRVLAEIILRY